jgi:uncharacterized protein YoxC
MLRKLVRSYYRLRYFPRNLFQLLGSISTSIANTSESVTNTSAAVSGVSMAVGGMSSAVGDMSSAVGDMSTVVGDMSTVVGNMSTAVADMSTAVADVSAGVAELRTQRRESFVRTSAALDDVHADLTAFCNDATKAILALNRSVGGMEKNIRTLATDLNSQAERIETLNTTVLYQKLILPSWKWTPEAGERVRSILALLSPVAVPDVAKVRLGRDQDGGYVMLDDFAGIATALSLGIADDISWDLDIAARGVRVLQFDPTVSAPPQAHRLLHFEPLLVAADDCVGKISLSSIVLTRAGAPDAPLLLKMDIEGSEWEVFDATDGMMLSRFKQIVCEFHTLDRLGEEEFGNRAEAVFKKLAATHFVYHVHGNNCANFASVGNIVVPQSLEVSFALRSAYRTARNTEVFPTSLDHPNQPGRADLYLGEFRFGR